MALAANALYVIRDNKRLAAQAVNTVDLFNGSYSFMGSRTHGTAATRGRVGLWTSAIGQIPLGFSTQRKTGDTGASPIVEAEVDLGGRVMKQITVTGLAGTVADQGRKVYMTDDGTFTLTRPASPSMPVGMVVKFNSATTADCYFFGLDALCALGLSGGDRRTWCIGNVAPTATAGTPDLIKGFVAPCHGRILAMYAICDRLPTDVDVSINIQAEIDGTNITGGIVTLLFSDTLGLKKAGTAVTDDGTNAFHEGSLIDIEVTTLTAAGTATDVGSYNLYLDVETDFGL